MSTNNHTQSKKPQSTTNNSNNGELPPQPGEQSDIGKNKGSMEKEGNVEPQQG